MSGLQLIRPLGLQVTQTLFLNHCGRMLFLFLKDCRLQITSVFSLVLTYLMHLQFLKIFPEAYG